MAQDGQPAVLVHLIVGEYDLFEVTVALGIILNYLRVGIEEVVALLDVFLVFNILLPLLLNDVLQLLQIDAAIFFGNELLPWVQYLVPKAGFVAVAARDFGVEFGAPRQEMVLGALQVGITLYGTGNVGIGHWARWAGM